MSARITPASGPAKAWPTSITRTLSKGRPIASSILWWPGWGGWAGGGERGKRALGNVLGNRPYEQPPLPPLCARPRGLAGPPHRGGAGPGAADRRPAPSPLGPAG